MRALKRVRTAPHLAELAEVVKKHDILRKGRCVVSARELHRTATAARVKPVVVIFKKGAR